jgi:hypothetical protein
MIIFPYKRRGITHDGTTTQQRESNGVPEKTAPPYTLLLKQAPQHGAGVRSTLIQRIVERAKERLAHPHGFPVKEAQVPSATYEGRA